MEILRLKSPIPDAHVVVLGRHVRFNLGEIRQQKPHGLGRAGHLSAEGAALQKACQLAVDADRFHALSLPTQPVQFCNQPP